VPLTRSFAATGSCDNEIPEDKDRQAGRRMAEINYDGPGAAYNRDPITPPPGAGTKENPIMVPSGEGHRTCGFECPQTHAIYWFNLGPTNLHFIPKLGLYFKLLQLEKDIA